MMMYLKRYLRGAGPAHARAWGAGRSWEEAASAGVRPARMVPAACVLPTPPHHPQRQHAPTRTTWWRAALSTPACACALLLLRRRRRCPCCCCCRYCWCCCCCCCCCCCLLPQSFNGESQQCVRWPPSPLGAPCPGRASAQAPGSRTTCSRRRAPGLMTRWVPSPLARTSERARRHTHCLCMRTQTRPLWGAAAAW